MVSPQPSCFGASNLIIKQILTMEADNLKAPIIKNYSNPSFLDCNAKGLII